MRFISGSHNRIHFMGVEQFFHPESSFIWAVFSIIQHTVC